MHTIAPVILTTVMPCFLVSPNKKHLKLTTFTCTYADEDQVVGPHYTLKSLHWLPMCFSIDIKVLLMGFKCLNGLGHNYLTELLAPYEPSQTLRSYGTDLVSIIPKVKIQTHGEAPT